MRGVRNFAVAVGVALLVTVGVVQASDMSHRILRWMGVGAERVVDVVQDMGIRIERVEEEDDDRDGVRHTSSQEADFEWTGRIEPGDMIEIRGVNGDVIAELAVGDEVVVEADKRGRRSDPDEVRIEVVEHGGGVTVCAVYPGAGNHCDVGGGRSNVRNNDVDVTFRVRVPAGVRFEGHTVNGDVEVDEMESDVAGHTVNGDVEIGTTGAAEATTVNGSVRARMGSRSWDGELDFKTVNGSIEVDVPDDVDADVEAAWVNGGLDLSLPLTLEGRVSRNRAEGRLGDGGSRMQLQTVNGSIRIR